MARLGKGEAIRFDNGVVTFDARTEVGASMLDMVMGAIAMWTTAPEATKDRLREIKWQIRQVQDDDLEASEIETGKFSLSNDFAIMGAE